MRNEKTIIDPAINVLMLESEMTIIDSMSSQNHHLKRRLLWDVLDFFLDLVQQTHLDNLKYLPNHHHAL